jgi:formylglycine-generating enzyme required for sulfatase activity
VDKYEASVWRIPAANAALIAKVKDGSVTLTELQGSGGVLEGAFLTPYICNDSGNDCNVDEYAASVSGVRPSAFVTWFQAQQFCHMAGKRLVSNAEWQAAAAGTPDGLPCIMVTTGTANSNGSTTGTPGCVSNAGAFDMVGNLAEWVADWIPAANSCSPALFGTDDLNCMAIDPAVAKKEGPAAIFRGGAYFTNTPNGVFYIVGSEQPSFSSQYLGFRCAR